MYGRWIKRHADYKSMVGKCFEHAWVSHSLRLPSFAQSCMAKDFSKKRCELKRHLLNPFSVWIIKLHVSLQRLHIFWLLLLFNLAFYCLYVFQRTLQACIHYRHRVRQKVCVCVCARAVWISRTNTKNLFKVILNFLQSLSQMQFNSGAAVAK